MSLILMYRIIPDTHFFDEVPVLFFLSLLVFHPKIFHHSSDSPELHWTITWSRRLGSNIYHKKHSYKEEEGACILTSALQNHKNFSLKYSNNSPTNYPLCHCSCCLQNKCKLLNQMPSIRQAPKQKFMATLSESKQHRAEAGVEEVVATPLAGIAISDSSIWNHIFILHLGGGCCCAW